MSNQVYAATTKGLFTIERNDDGRWRVARTSFLGDNVTMMLPDHRDGALYAAVGHGHFGAKLHRSLDGGDKWEEVQAPKYPERPAGVEEEKDQWGKPIPWSLKRIWELAAGHDEEPGVLWAGTVPGGLFRSGDRGESWTLMRSLWDREERKKWFGGGVDLPGIHSVMVDPRDRRHVTAGVSCGGAWTTRDGGETWNNCAQGMYAEFMPPEGRMDPNIQDPHRIVACPAAPDTMWAQHHNGIFKTTDAGNLWTEVTGWQVSKFGFAVAIHPRDPNTVWLVPAIKDEKRIPVDGKVVVSRTRDAGETFEVLRNGLPQEHAYDLTYRHAMDIDESGDRLAFGSTTGTMWVSEDQGDKWQTVSKHLPPISTVRFMKR